MATVFVGGSGLGNALQTIFACGPLVPGDPVSYEAAKTIYAYHPLGARLAEKPVEMAQSQPRKITVDAAGGKKAVEAFQEEWTKLDADGFIYQAAVMSRVYGVCSVAVIVDGDDTSQPLDLAKVAEKDVTFNVLDPLNTSGSLVISQAPNSADFLKPKGGLVVQGQAYHATRCVTKMNERPVYIEYTSSGFGYVGRSVYQRTLFPLKSFLQTMVADDMVARKAGIIVAKIQPAGSIVDRFQQMVNSVKRSIVKEAENESVISIGPDEDIQAIGLQNVHEALGAARQDILNNIAAGAGMPAKLVNEETFAQGFGEGSEDSRHVAQYIDNYRVELKPLYDFFTRICQVRAWSPEFIKSLQESDEADAQFRKMSYEQVFLSLRQAFKAEWPSLIDEPDQKEFEQEQLRLEAVTALCQIMLPFLDPYNRAIMIQWVADNLNAFEKLFAEALALDVEQLAAYDPQAQAEGPVDKKERQDAQPPVYKARRLGIV